MWDHDNIFFRSIPVLVLFVVLCSLMGLLYFTSCVFSGVHVFTLVWPHTELLRRNPAGAVPVILKRLKQKDLEWRKSRQQLNQQVDWMRGNNIGVRIYD